RAKESKTFPFLEKLFPTVQTNLAELQQDDGQWVMPAKNYASTRFSALNQIDAGNVKNLRVAWTFSTGHDRGEEAAPLVVNNTMYVVTPFPNILYALDLTQPGAPVKWSYKPKNLNNAAKGIACCDWVNRGCAYANGKIFFNTLDGRTCAVDADTGREVWSSQVTDVSRGDTIPSAPLDVKTNGHVGGS